VESLSKAELGVLRGWLTLVIYDVNETFKGRPGNHSFVFDTRHTLSGLSTIIG